MPMDPKASALGFGQWARGRRRQTGNYWKMYGGGELDFPLQTDAEAMPWIGYA
jgi:hypothetical protein